VKLPAKLFGISALIFLGRIGGAGVMFGSQALIAKWLGTDALGQYLQANAAANLCGGLLPLGFQTIAAYFTAEYASKAMGTSLRSFLRQAYAQTALMAVFVFLLGTLLLERFLPNNPGITQNWAQICIFGTAIGFVVTSGGVLNSLKRPLLGMTADTVLRPLLIAGSLAMVLVPAAASLKVSDMLWFAAGGYFLISLGFIFVATRFVKRIATAVDTLPRHERGRWWNYALPWTLIGLATDFFFDLDLLLLSGSLNYSEIAVFGVMTRLFSLASFGVSSVYFVSLPDMFADHASNNTQSFKASLSRTNLVAMGISLMMVLGIVVCGPFALSFFGPDFHQGTLPLVILSLALATRCVFGPAALMLSMHNRPYAALPSVFIGLILLVIGNLILVPPMGLYGAALAALIAMAAWSANMWWTTLRLTGTDISIFLPVLALMKAKPAA